jgi:phage terminase large subunit-like protein
VVAGKIKTGSSALAACRRHLSDLEHSKRKDYPYSFDPKKGNRICEFAERMVHIKGKWARTTDGSLPLIQLQDWQCFLLAVPFGWVRKRDGLRRFREIFAEIPRKNSKSTMGAIVGLFMGFADDEPGAEVFAGATSMEQALAVFKPAWLMVKNNPEFQEHFGLDLGGTPSNPGPIVQLSSGSRFAPIIGKPGDGDSPHCAIVDEYHEHVTPVMYDAMKTGMGSRTQPMRVVITTAGVDTSGPCYDKHIEAEKILNGTLENDDTFAVMFAADPDEDWQDFNVWKRANPNYGVSVFEDYLRGQHRDALQSPSQQNINRTKHLNQWMSAGAAWMNMATWEECKDESLELSQFVGKRCWLGADLASKIDIASLAYIFEAPWGFAFFCKHYLPEDTIELPENAHYRKWRDDPRGWLTQTDGARTDLKLIEDEIRDASRMFAVQSLAFDQKESNYLITNVQEWASFDCIDVPQAPAHISEPMKEMEAQIYAKTLRHQGDPILTWMMGNVIKKAGRTGGPIKSYYPTKQNAKMKIDGVVAGLMALSRAMLKSRTPKFQMMFV